MRDSAISVRSAVSGFVPVRLERAFRVGQRLAVDLGLGPFDPPDEIGFEADHRIAPAHRAAFHRFEQEAVSGVAGELQHDRDRGLEVGHELGGDHLGAALGIGGGEGVELWQDLHGDRFAGRPVC
jgi:hypothetical protein